MDVDKVIAKINQKRFIEKAKPSLKVLGWVLVGCILLVAVYNVAVRW